MASFSFGLDYFAVPDVVHSLNDAIENNYHFVVLPIVHPRFRRKASSVADFTRSDMLLDPEEWAVRVVGKLSPYLDVDCPNETVSRRHEDVMVEELGYIQNLTLSAFQFTLNSRKPYNLVRILQNHCINSHHRSQIWVKVPMLAEYMVNSEEEECEEAYEEPWVWWSRLHELMDWDRRVGAVLEMTADLPPEAAIKRWLGEPVKAVVVPTHLFNTNKKGYPVLSRAHQEVLLRFARQDAQLVVSGARRCPIQQYSMYLQHLCENRPNLSADAMISFSRGWEDYLQTPLQPLADNLDTNTYSVFEKDALKYRQYQKAIALALLELRKREKTNNAVQVTKETESENTEKVDKAALGEKADNVNESETGQGDASAEEDDRVYRIAVLGAGRGPLVRAAFNAADITKTKVQVVALEKNPCALVSLAAQAREVWSTRQLQVVSGDMRHVQQLQPADIIVSELLGSWGDNELSPECLDGAARLLRPGGISIPSRYTSYAAPITSASLWAAARDVPTSPHYRSKNNLENLWVVYMKNIHHIANTEAVFTFTHPAESIGADGNMEPYRKNETQEQPDNRRHTMLTWRAEQAGVLHGFSGYFDCELFGEEHISIEPSTHTPGMISWFPIYIPIRTPLRFKKGEEIKVSFWRCVNTRKVWYEWLASVGDRTTPIHNISGRSFEMLL